MRIRTPKTAAAGVIALALALGACGDDDDDAGDASPDTTAADAGDGASVTIADFAFDPAELTVASGDTVSVSNEDSTAHTFSSDDAGFSLELAGGESGDVDVTAEPGSYDFRCNIHGNMQGTITVE